MEKKAISKEKIKKIKENIKEAIFNEDNHHYNSPTNKIGKCLGCKKRKKLTNHSIKEHHIPPFIYLCFVCHRIEHGTIN